MPFRLFERGPTTPGLGDDNDHHGCEVLKSWDDAPSRGFLLVASRTSFSKLSTAATGHWLKTPKSYVSNFQPG